MPVAFPLFQLSVEGRLVRKHIQAIASCVVLPLALFFTLFGEFPNSVGQAANVRIQLDHKSLVFSPEESLSITVGLADFHAEPGTLVRCTAGAIRVADGKSSWNAVQEEQVDEAGGFPDFQPFHQKTPSVEGAFQLEIKLAIRQAGSAAPFNQIFIKRLPLLVVADGKESEDQPAAIPGDPEKTESNSSTQDLLAMWNESGDFARKIGLGKRTERTAELDWDHIFNQCTAFVSELKANGHSTVAIPTNVSAIDLYPAGNTAPAKPMAKADVLELLMRRLDQSGSDVYLVIPGQETTVIDPIEGTEELSTSVPLLVLEQTEFGSYALPYNRTRHQIPSCVRQAVNRVVGLYSEHISFKAIVIDCRGCSTKMISQTTLTECQAIPLVDASATTKEQFNKRLSVAIASTCPGVIFVSHLPGDDGLPPAFVGIGEPVSELASMLKAIRKDIDSLAIHSATTHLENLGFEILSDGKLSEWDIHLTEGATVQVDKTHFREGTQSVHLRSPRPGRAISLRSKSFQFHPTRRIAIEAWVRLEPEVDAPSVRLVLEGEYQGQRFTHQVELPDNTNLADVEKKQGEWIPLTLQIDKLPREGISNLRVAIDLSGAGNVWVDNLQLSDMWLSEEEYQDFIAALTAAEQSLAAGRTDDVQIYLATTLPNQLAKFAEVNYLAPSLAQATSVATPATTELTTAPTAQRPVQQVSVAKTSSSTDPDITPIVVEDVLTAEFVSDLEPTEQPATIAQRVAATVKKSELVSMFGQLVDKEMAGRKQTESASAISESKSGANATTVINTKPIGPSLNSDTGSIADPKSAIAATRTGAPWWKFWESAGEELDGIEANQISPQSSTASEPPPQIPIARQDGDVPGTINDAPDAAKSTFRSLWTSLWGSSQNDTPTPEITPATPEITPVTHEITPATPEITPAVNSVAVTQTTIDTEREGNRLQRFFWFMHRENESGKSDPSEGTPNDGNFTRLTSLWRLPRFGSNENNEVLAETAPGADVGELQRAIPAAESDLGPATIDPPRSHFFSRFLVRQEPPQSELDSEVPQSTSTTSRLLSFFGIRREDQQEQAEIAPEAVATPKAIIATRPSIGITTRSTQPDSVSAKGAEPGNEKSVMDHLRANPPTLVR